MLLISFVDSQPNFTGLVLFDLFPIATNRIATSVALNPACMAMQRLASLEQQLLAPG